MLVRTVKPPASQAEADVLAIPVVSGDTAQRAPLRDIDRALGGQVAAALESAELNAKPLETTLWPVSGIAARRLLVVGAGERSELDADQARRVAGAAARKTRSSYDTVAVVPRSDAHVEAMVEGFLLGAFEPDLYRTDRTHTRVSELRIVTGGDVSGAIRAGTVMAEATNLARTLVSEPPNELTPTRLAERARQELEPLGVDVQVLTGQALEPFGALVGVAKGSEEPPVLITATWAPARAKRAPVLGLAGKGITFDSGGLSLKPTEGMEWMKGDMAGAAAVIGAMKAIATLKLPLRVKAAVPATENMPSGTAMRVGDVLHAYSGTTIEVLNTDAEGRLVLADALSWLAEQGVTHAADVATLTGAVEIALGKVAFGVLGRPDRWVDRVVANARKAGERAWPLPLYPEYREQLRSEIADLKNIGGRPAGAITAGSFLAEFVPDGLPWAHLDIAGVAWADGKPYLAKGATGAAVRALARLAQDLSGKV